MNESVVMCMYTGAKTVVRTVYGNSNNFEVKVSMLQGSALSPLLFVIVVEALSRELRVTLPWELLYADDLVVIAETEDDLIKRLNHIRAHTHTHTAVLWLSGFCLQQTRWAGTRRNINTLTLLWSSIIPYLFPPSITFHGFLSVQFTCLTVFFHNLSPSFLWSTSWSCTLHFILHTFLHPIIVFFSQQMPIPLQPVLLKHLCFFRQ